MDRWNNVSVVNVLTLWWLFDLFPTHQLVLFETKHVTYQNNTAQHVFIIFGSQTPKTDVLFYSIEFNVEKKLILLLMCYILS